MPRFPAGWACLIGIVPRHQSPMSISATARATSANTTTVAATPEAYAGSMSYFSPSYPGPKCPLCRQCQWAVPGRCIYGGPYLPAPQAPITANRPQTIDEALREAWYRAENQPPAMRDVTRQRIRMILNRRAMASTPEVGIQYPAFRLCLDCGATSLGKTCQACGSEHTETA